LSATTQSARLRATPKLAQLPLPHLAFKPLPSTILHFLSLLRIPHIPDKQPYKMRLFFWGEYPVPPAKCTSIFASNQKTPPCRYKHTTFVPKKQILYLFFTSNPKPHPASVCGAFQTTGFQRCNNEPVFS